MAAFPRTYFDTPVADPMAGWSEDRKRFFIRMGYDRGPDPVSVEQGGLLMGEGNILQRRRNPEVNVKITETPPDDPTPTKKVTSIKYPTEPPYMGAEEQWGAQAGLPAEGLLGPTDEELAASQAQAFQTEGPLSLFQQEGEDFYAGLDPRDQDYISGLPEEERFDAVEAFEGLVSGENQVVFVDDDGQDVTMDDILGMQVGVGRFGPGVKILKSLPPQLKIKWLRDWWRKIKPKRAAGKIDYETGFTAKQLDRARAQQKLLQNAETAALIGTGVAGGAAVGLLDRPDEDDFAFEDIRGGERGGSAVEESGITTEQIVGDYEGLLVGQEDDSGIPITARTGFITKSEVGDTSREDAGEQQAELNRFYANFPEDIEGKRSRYLKALKEIYKKVAILNVIAALTNSPSQAGAFMQMAAEKFKTLEGFRGEERLQKIARGVFFTEDGQFDAPQSKQDAFNRAIRFGANHEEALELSGHKKEYAPTTTALPGYVTWNRTDPDTGEMIEESFRKGVHPRDLGYGEGWSVGQGRAPTEPAWYRSMQRIETTLRSSGRTAAINELIWFWGSDPWFRMVFGEELEEQAEIHVDQILAGRTPPLPTEGGATERVITPGSIKQAGA